MARLRVLVVEDSLTVREHLVAVLRSDDQMEVVGQASDGQQAIALCQQLRPDVVTLDMVLPTCSGELVTEQIMANCPTPILIVSGSHNRGELYQTYDALAAGALEVLEKPHGDSPSAEWGERLLTLVKRVARIKVITHLRGRLRAPERAGPTAPVAGPPLQRVVAIGTSTGGPGALVTLLGGLPSDFCLPIVAVIHIGEPFGAEFARWLDGQSRLRVAYASEGEALAQAAGRVLLAPPDRHVVVRGGQVHLTRDQPCHSCRPAVDVLFSSLASDLGSRTIACLLTGMGKDGAQGMLAIRRAGGLTIAQDEATSVVFGMPREAILLGAASQVLPLQAIAPQLVRLAHAETTKKGGPV